MTIDLKAVEGLAADQASLKAAAGLAKPGAWSGVGISHDDILIWGECAGSGANPYRVMADLRDLGNKCTCPSRKFPCKHSLALLWIKAEAIVPFGRADAPDWVGDWLGRRRAGGPKPAASGDLKDIGVALEVTPDELEDPKAAARREALAAKRSEDTERAILDALDALEQWIADQLRLGLASFIGDTTTRCRRIAARLVDGKAAALAGRIDELPARLLALPVGDRPRGAVVELGKLVLLARAFRTASTNQELPIYGDIRRAVATSETRDAVLAGPSCLRVSARWDVLAERVRTRRDGLISQTTWLLNLGEQGPRFAMLLDYFPAGAGRRGSVFVPGEQFEGDLAFYSAPHPMRAVLVGRVHGHDDRASSDWPAPDTQWTDKLAAPLLAEPWSLEVPVLLPPGRIAIDPTGRAWWRPSGETTALPVIGDTKGVMRGTELTRTAALWSGNQLAILAAQTAWGRIGGHG